MKVDGRQRELGKDEIPYWHLLPIIVFVGVNGLIWYFQFDHLTQIQKYINTFNMVVFGLATYRIANIVSNEQVLKVLRAPFIRVKDEEDGGQQELPREGGIRNTVGTLLYCPSCVGVWVAALITYLFVFTPTIAWIVVVVFALSAVERIITNAVAALDSLG